MSIKSANLTLERRGDVFILTLHKAPENRIDVAFAQEIISAVRHAERELKASGRGGALITKGNDAKFFCTGLDLHESDINPHANADGFYPLLATIMDFPYPTIALLTGHTFGGACPYALSHDYRIMNSKRGFISMPPVDLGLHFDGIGTLPRLKLRPQIARKMLLEAHRWTGKEALQDGVVDELADPENMLEVALQVAEKWQGKGKMGVYALLRGELWGQAAEAFRRISYVHGRNGNRPKPAKI